MTRATAVMIGVWVLAGAAEAEAQKMRLGEVLVMVPFDAAPPPVADGMVFQADRGGRKGQYLVVTKSAATAGSTAGGGRASEYRLLSPQMVGLSVVKWMSRNCVRHAATSSATDSGASLRARVMN